MMKKLFVLLFVLLLCLPLASCMKDEDYYTKADIESLIDTLEAEYQLKLDTLEAEYQVKLDALNADCEADVSALDEAVEEQITALTENYKTKLTELEIEYEAKLAVLTELINTNAGKISALEEQIEKLISSMDKKHEVTFVTDSGDNVASQSVIHGEKIEKPVSPEKPGYHFIGWYADDEKWSFVGDVVTRDVTLVARFEKVFTVSGNKITGLTHYAELNLYDIVIPEEIEGVAITAIGDKAFYNAFFTTVTIPNTITSIGREAFYGCEIEHASIPTTAISHIPKSSLKTVVITGGNSIEDSAFYWCATLTSVTIGNSVTSIGDSAFYGCTSLINITIGNSVTSIGDSAFHTCHKLTSIIIPDSVTHIGGAAFYWCEALTSVTFEDTSTWYRTSSSSYTGGTQISVTNPTDNVTHFRTTYHFYKK